MIAPKRRWFRWSLRTMFVVVTVAACWLGWNMNEVQQRKRLIAWADSKGVQFDQPIPSRKLPPTLKAIPSRKVSAVNGVVMIPRRMPRTDGISWFRTTFLGDRPIQTICIPSVWRNEKEAIEFDAAFPEAELIFLENVLDQNPPARPPHS